MERVFFARVPFRLSVCAAAIGALFAPAFAQPSQTESVPKQPPTSVFNDALLDTGSGQKSVDLSLFAFGNRILPGRYTVDVSLNERNVGKVAIQFDDKEGASDAVPCLTRRMLEDWGVNVPAFPALAALADDGCVADLRAAVPDAFFGYDGVKQRLTLSIPQAALHRSARGAVDPSKWDRGINAGMLDYQINFSRYGGDGYRREPDQFALTRSLFDNNPFAPRPRDPERNTLFVGLRAGFNYGDWRFRHYSTYSRGVSGAGGWQAVETYAQRDLASLKGRLLIGDGSTPGNFFDSVPFRGVQLASDESMLPNSQQGYAPTIRGIAQTNARVTVRQNGYVIYSTFVAPGAFVIDDLNPTGSGSDLEVIVTEADGRETRNFQSFATVPTLLREDAWRYSATVGKYRRASGLGRSYNSWGGLSQWPWTQYRQPLAEPAFVQASLARGLNDDYTIYGGLIASGRYQSLLAGVGRNLRAFGAVSADITAARTLVPMPLLVDRTYNGQSIRFLYSKAFDAGTSIRVAGYRYSTGGYRTFQEAVDMQGLLPFERLNNRRNELRLDLSQPLGDDWGALYVSARQQSYWDEPRKDRAVQIGWTGNYKQVGFSVNYSRGVYQNFRPSSQVMFTVSVPLGDSGVRSQYSATRDRDGRTNHQASVSGSALDDSRFNYNVMVGRDDAQGSTGVASASYLSPVGRFDLGHSQGRNYRQTTVGMAGGLVVHAGGATLSQSLGETIALAQLPKASNVGFESLPGVRTDWAGNAVLPSLSPYRLNRLAVRTQDLGDNIDVKNAATEVAPTRGAVVLVNFETAVGYRLMLTLTGRTGEPLPFGARIENEAGVEIGMVGAEGQSFVSGAEAKGRMTVRWGQGSADQCTLSYELPEEAKPPPIRELSAICG
jgi:outer membrane usher protein